MCIHKKKKYTLYLFIVGPYIPKGMQSRHTKGAQALRSVSVQNKVGTRQPIWYINGMASVSMFDYVKQVTTAYFVYLPLFLPGHVPVFTGLFGV